MKPSETPNLQTAIDRFLARYPNEETVRAYRQPLDNFVKGVDPTRPVDSFDENDLDQWDQRMRARGLAKATIASHRRRMKTFWLWCIDRGYIEKSPARFLRVKRYRASLASKAMPSHVVKAMLQAVSKKRERLPALRDTAILGLIVTYGARRGDVARLRLELVHLREEWIILHTKGDKELRLPLPPELAYHLQRWLDIRLKLPAAHDFVFTTTRPNESGVYPPLNPESVASMIQRLSEKVCGVMYGPHSIRHWFGQHQADRRIPPTLLRDLMGHCDVKITLDHYYNQDFDRMKAVLLETEMARDLVQNAPADHPKIINVDFSRRAI